MYTLQLKVKHITASSPHYPPLLRHIPQPPAVLYYRGNIALLQAAHMIAIVGSRKMSAYGKTATHDAVRGVVARGIVTVSGLAFGIDQTAHEATLEYGGQTVAVLGSPVETEQLHPQSNRGLADRIVRAGGLLVSEYPSGSAVYASHFPARNRIIAGLCGATLVVEASQKSGSLITARYAVECGRNVYAVPGSIFSPVSVGTNALLERGAIPWLSCASLVGDIEYQRPGLAASNAADASQHAVLAACADSPQTIDTLCANTGLTAADVMRCVTLLVLNGLLRDLGDHTYVQ